MRVVNWAKKTEKKKRQANPVVFWLRPLANLIGCGGLAPLASWPVVQV